VTNHPDNNWSDKDLVEKVLNKNTQAFSIIIKNTERLVAGIIFKMIDNTEDRKDLAQDIYVKVYKKLPGFRFQSKLSTWIAQICYNTCLDHLRKKKLVLTGDWPSEDGPTGEITLTDTDHPQLKGILQAAIEKLPPVYRTLITLYHTEEMSYDELHQVTGLPQGTIKSYLFRARKTLRNSLLHIYKKEDL
jgi:RNA polymerase sigma-70 factor (ECF subfamily)